MLTSLRWTGPFLVRDYLENAINDAWKQLWPPAADGVYLVSRHHWAAFPTESAEPLYVGGNTGRSERFCTRVGDLIADVHGFYDGDTGHHSGGQSLWRWCNKNRVKPGDLWLAWANNGHPWCAKCAERALYKAFKATLENKNTPSGCRSPDCQAAAFAG